MASFTAAYPIHTYESDAAGRATFGALFRFLQDIAAAHAIEIGYGLDDLKENSNMWVLSRFLYRAYRTPLWRETLRIETWPSGTESLFALREWILRDEQEREVGVATSSWVVIDIATRRPVRIERVAERMDMIVDRRVFDRTAGKVPSFEQGKPSFETRASFADIDLNGHVNATRYVEWMFEGLPKGFREGGRELQEIEINFSGESMAGDAVSVFTAGGASAPQVAVVDGGSRSGVQFLHCVQRGADVVCRARSAWQ